MRRILLVVSFVFLSVLLVGCSSSSLTREKAAEIIPKSPEFGQFVANNTIPVEVNDQYSKGVLTEPTNEEINQSVEEALSSKGYIYVNSSGRNRVTFTEQGEQNLTFRDGDALLSVTPKFEEVTGVAQEGNSALVEIMLGHSLSPINEGEIELNLFRKLKLQLTKFDDGWRVTEIKS